MGESGKHLRVIHGTRDRWTPIPGVGHFMLRRVGKWNQFVEDSVSDILGPALQKGAPTEGTP